VRGHERGGAGARPPVSPWARLAGAVAALAGVAYVWLVLGSNLLLQYQREPLPPDRLQDLARIGLVVAVVVLLSRVTSARLLVVVGLVAAWLAAPALSSWGLTGRAELWFLSWAVIGGALLLAAAASPRWVGWSLVALAMVLVAMNWLVYWRTYYSFGAVSPGAGQWLLPQRGWAPALPSPEDQQFLLDAGMPYPQDRVQRLVALVRSVPEFAPFSLVGSSSNANYTGNFVAPAVAFGCAFLLRGHEWDPARRPWPVRVLVALAALGLLTAGLLLLHALAARTAALALLVALLLLLVPVRWARNPWWASLAAAAAVLVVVAPPAASRQLGSSFSGRDCVWRSWWAAVSEQPRWGIGPPGAIDSVCGEFFIVNAHNELLQAMSIGGLLGLVAAVATLGLLVWLGVRRSDRDGRQLLVVMACLLTLMGLEVLTTDWAILWPVAMWGACLGLILPRRPPAAIGPADRSST
jgi:hypothetical protein